MIFGYRNLGFLLNYVIIYDMIKVILILYLLFLIVYLIVATLALYHLWRFGFQKGISKTIIVVYSIIIIALIILSFIAIGMLNWNISILGF